MRTLVIANRDDADTGHVGERLLQLEARITLQAREDLATVRQPEAGADLIVLLGSDWSVYDPRRADAVGAEQALVRRAEERGVPLFAICFGAQLVASTLGLAVTRASSPEIGWREIDTNDPWLCPPGPWFQFHFDRWADGAPEACIAHTAACPQALVHGRILAVQFHPEVTAPVARRWLRAQPDDVAAAGESVEAIEATLDELMPAARARCHALVDRFLAWAALPLKCAPLTTDRPIDQIADAPQAGGSPISLVLHAPGPARGTTHPAGPALGRRP